MGPESLKLIKLTESDNIEAFLTTFERGAEAHGVDRDKHAAILAPQLTGKAHLACATMTDADARDYDRVKANDMILPRSASCGQLGHLA